jgi:hypothetical protein
VTGTAAGGRWRALQKGLWIATIEEIKLNRKRKRKKKKRFAVECEEIEIIVCC